MVVDNFQNLSILSWNATGIMSSSTYFSDTFNEKHIDIYDILEHWLYEKDLPFLTATATEATLYRTLL